MNTRKILITGSTGFIGSAVLNEFNKKQNSSIIITSRYASSDNLTHDNKQCIKLDLAATTITLPDDIHTILHIAGEKKNELNMWQINFEGTKKLLEAAKNVRVQKFIYLSSVGVYGATNHGGKIDTNSLKYPQNIYEKSKKAAEDFVHSYCKKNNIRYTILQPSNVIGYIDGRIYSLLGLMKIIKKGIFSYFGNMQTISNYIDYKNVAAALVYVCENNVSNDTYILNTPCTLKKIIQWISEELNITPSNKQLPLLIGKAAGYAGDITQKITGNSFYFDTARFRELSNTSLFDGDEFCRTLNFEYPLNIEDTIRQLVRSYVFKKLL